MTARQRYERGFQVVFGSNVTAADDPAMHENELKAAKGLRARHATGRDCSGLYTAA